MTPSPWRGDAVSLVDAFRRGELSPREALDESLQAIESSSLNAISYIDADAARASADRADVTLPFGGVPIGVKELEDVRGWPQTEASLVFAHRIADDDSLQVGRLRAAGAVVAVQTTASEFGGINCTSTKLHGATHNPWQIGRTPGGSSGGSAAAVAGGLVPIATGGDGGGSIRIPAGFTGLLGLKGTFGRIPRGPKALHSPLTVSLGCMARSVRDTARWFDVCNGFSPYDTLSLPRVDGWEAGLGTIDLTGRRVAVVYDLGNAIVSERQVAVLDELSRHLIAAAGLTQVDVVIAFPTGGLEWAMSNAIGLVGELGDLYPDCAPQLTREIQLVLRLAQGLNASSAGATEIFRSEMNFTMARVFEETDFIFCATNPDVAFRAEGPMSTTVDGVDLVEKYGLNRAIGNNGALTIPANLTGVPAISIPAGTVDGLPVGLQVIGRHHDEQSLLELALIAERDRPWPLTAPLPA
ncbi:MAG: amidase [Acidobacteria bacterium]|nr:amidase [Acidobacteriota bacterium]